MILVGGLVAIFYFPIYWVANHPNWRTHIFQDGVAKNHQAAEFMKTFGGVLPVMIWELNGTSFQQPGFLHPDRVQLMGIPRARSTVGFSWISWDIPVSNRTKFSWWLGEAPLSSVKRISIFVLPWNTGWVSYGFPVLGLWNNPPIYWIVYNPRTNHQTTGVLNTAHICV